MRSENGKHDRARPLARATVMTRADQPVVRSGDGRPHPPGIAGAEEAWHPGGAPETPPSDRGFLWVGIAFLVLGAIITAPWWWDGLVVPWDARNHFYAMLRWLAAALHEHGWPGYMREIYAGRPVLGDPQSMILSPGFLLLSLFDPTPSMKAMDLLILGELGLGALAVMALARLQGIPPVVALLAALVTAFGGAAMARLQHTLLVQSYAFVPVVLLALEAALRRPSLLRGSLFGLALGLLAVGRDHVALLGLAVVLGWALADVAGRAERVRFLGRALPAIGMAAAVAAIVALPPALATLSFAEVSNRPAFNALDAGRGGVPPEALVTLFSANYFGTLIDYKSYWGPGTAVWPPLWIVDRATVQLFAGTAVAVLVTWLGLLRGQLFRPGGRFAGAAFACLLLYAMGTHTPAYELFFTLPGVDKFRRPADATFLLNLTLALAVLAIGHRYLRGGLPAVPRWRPWTEGAVAGAGLAAAGAIAAGRDALWSAAGPLALAMVIGAVTVGALGWGARGGPGRRRLVMLGLTALTAGELAVFSAGTLLNAHAPDRYGVLESPDSDPVARAVAARVAALEAEHGPVRVALLGLGGAWQNMSLVLGIENTLGYNPLRFAAYDAATGAGQNSHRAERNFGALMPSWAAPFADLLGVRLLVLGRPLAEIDPRSAGAFGPPERVGTAYLYERKTALPRVLLVAAERVRPHPDEALLSGLGTLPDLDWRTEALVGVAEAAASSARNAAGPGAPESAPPERVQGASVGSVRILDYRPDGMDVAIAPAVPAFLIVHELRAPGWTAEVDGLRRTLLAANALFQAVRVGPGDRRVAFRYRPEREIWAGLPGVQ